MLPIQPDPMGSFLNIILFSIRIIPHRFAEGVHRMFETHDHPA